MAVFRIYACVFLRCTSICFLQVLRGRLRRRWRQTGHAPARRAGPAATGRPRASSNPRFRGHRTVGPVRCRLAQLPAEAGSVAVSTRRGACVFSASPPFHRASADRTPGMRCHGIRRLPAPADPCCVRPCRWRHPVRAHRLELTRCLCPRNGRVHDSGVVAGRRQCPRLLRRGWCRWSTRLHCFLVLFARTFAPSPLPCFTSL